MDELRRAPRGHLNRGVKRFVDVVGAMIALICFSPLMLGVALLILGKDGRPLLHREYRVGRGDQPFPLLKFRTLRPHTEALGTVAPEDDPRITAIGRWLRRWRLDEFPQLINVLAGDMSLVGPRPLPPAHAETLSDHERSELFTVRPGITGPDAIYFLADDAVLAGHADAESIYMAKILPKKVEMQLHYVRYGSLLTDLRVIIRTLRLLWSPRQRKRSVESVLRILDHDRG